MRRSQRERINKKNEKAQRDVLVKDRPEHGLARLRFDTTAAVLYVAKDKAKLGR